MCFKEFGVIGGLVISSNPSDGILQMERSISWKIVVLARSEDSRYPSTKLKVCHMAQQAKSEPCQKFRLTNLDRNIAHGSITMRWLNW